MTNNAKIRSALAEFLRNPDELNRMVAAELGRAACHDGVGLVEWAAAVHTVVIETVKAPDVSRVRSQIGNLAQVFLMETLSAYDSAFRSSRDVSNALRQEIDRLEAQAKHVSREMHDTAGQLLVSAYMELHLAAHASSEAAPYLNKANAILDQLQQHLRRFARDLRPTVLDDLGLMPALRALGQTIAANGGIEVTVEGDTEGRLSPSVELALYRTAEEALSNAVAHSGAARAEILVERRSDEIRCTVTDDGKGFAESELVSNASLGLVGVRERLEPLGGSLRWGPMPTSPGSVVVATVPVT